MKHPKSDAIEFTTRQSARGTEIIAIFKMHVIEIVPNDVTDGQALDLLGALSDTLCKAVEEEIAKCR